MMSDLKRTVRFRAQSVLAIAGAVLLTGPTTSLFAAEQGRPVPDTFEATTTGMTPDGVTLKLDVLNWSDEAARAAVVEALGAEDVTAALSELPSAGVVWRSGSAVGHSIKYAYRDQDEQGRDRITVVTDKPLDAYSFKPWSVEGRPADVSQGFGVVELVIGSDGAGSGTLSLAADVEIDTAAGLVSLAEDGPAVLTGARELPKPYWATTDSD